MTPDNFSDATKITNQSSTTFTVEFNEYATISYSFDGINYVSATGDKLILSGLPEGSNTVFVRGIDSAGNASSATPYTWTTDYTAPVISIKPQVAPDANGKTEVKVTLTGNETVAFTSLLDGTTSLTGASLDLKDLASGAHRLEVTATDQAGNASSQSISFNLDRYPLSGKFSSSVGNVLGSATGEIANISGQSWSGWSLETSGSGNATPSASWTLAAGGKNADGSFWLDVAPGTTDSTARTLAGRSQLTYLSKSYLGVGTGTVTGRFDGLGAYTLTDVGSDYAQKPLTFLSDLSVARTGGYSTTTNSHTGNYVYAGGRNSSYQGYEQGQFLGGLYFPDDAMIFQKRTQTVAAGLYYIGSKADYLNFQPPLGRQRFRTAYYIDPKDGSGVTASRTESWDEKIGQWISTTATTSGTWDASQPFSAIIGPPPSTGYTSGPNEMVNPAGFVAKGFTGIMGGSDSLWSATDLAPAGVTLMGSYDVPLTDPAQIWGTRIESRNYLQANGTAYNGGAFSGYLAGSDTVSSASPGQRGLSGMAEAIYIDPSGNAGYLRGSLTGYGYPGTGMVLMGGNLGKKEMKTGIGILPENLSASLWSFDHEKDDLTMAEYKTSSFAGDFSGAGKISSTYSVLDTLSIANYETHEVQPWGIYKQYLAGTFKNPAAGSSWSGGVGGRGVFGPSRAYKQTLGGYAYSDGGYYSYEYNDINEGNSEYFRKVGTSSYQYVTKRYYSNGVKTVCIDGTCDPPGTWTPATTSLSSVLETPPDAGYVSSTRQGPQSAGPGDDGVWLAKVTGSNGSDNTLTGTLSGRFITYTKMGDLSGNILGNYDTATGTWQARSLGEYSGKPLLFANRIEGDLYKQNTVTYHDTRYETPVSGYGNFPVQTMSYSTGYIVSGNPPKYGMQSEEINQGNYRSFRTYYPSDTYIGYYRNSSYNNNSLFMGAINRTSVFLSWPDLSTSPPTTPNPTPGLILTSAWPVTTPIMVGVPGHYAKTLEVDYTGMNVMERVLPTTPTQFDQTFTGIMGGYQLPGGANSLWTSNASNPVGVAFLGGQQDATLPLVFRVRRFFSQNYPVNGGYPSPTADGGAYIGFLSGTVSSDRSIDAMMYGLYMSPTVGGTWEAGFLKPTATLTGKSYAGVNMDMWDADGKMYREPYVTGLTSSTFAVDASHLLDQLPNTSWVNINLGGMGYPGKKMELYGQFKNGAALGGEIKSLVSAGFGNTWSIKNIGYFGIFEMLHGGLNNTYANPDGYTNWHIDMASTGQFGGGSNFGLWTASIDGVVGSPDKISGTLTGEYLTYWRQGPLRGTFLGNLMPVTSTTGTWQGATVGYWGKERSVNFSSTMIGRSYYLEKRFSGGDANSNYWSSKDLYGSYDHADSYTNLLGPVINYTQYNWSGPPDQKKYNKTVWLKDITNPASPVYTLQEATELSAADYNSAIDAIISNPLVTEGYNINWRNDHDGVFAGFNDVNGNLWDHITNGQSTELALMGQSGEMERKPTIFGGTIISFNPDYNMSSYYDSTYNPNGSKSPIGGAYYGFLGAAFGKKVVAADWLDGMINGLYRDPRGNVGLFYGKFTGNNNPQIGAWTGTGTIDGGYVMGTAGSGLTEANFASKVLLGSRDWLPEVEVTVTGDSIQPRTKSNSTAVITKDLLTPSGSGFWGIYQNRTGGTYSGTPTAWSYEAKNGTIQTEYVTVQMNATESNGIRTGDVVGVGVVYDNNPSYTFVSAGAIRGLFDPVKSTYQSVAQGTFMDTATFVNKVSSMNDAQRQAFTDATKIPAFVVGTTDLRGSGSGPGGTINLGSPTVATQGILNATFYAPSTGGKPQLWASGNVTGAYTGSPAAGTVNLYGYAPGSTSGSNNGITANLNIQQWTGTKWGATVTNGNVPAGASGFTYPNAATTGITFKGGAAGSINSSVRTFSGTAAGIVK
ncbi:MAG: hypothetical protein WCK00_01765 [Deltaproteobacteria bacterium]